ncbi:MAG: GAF domain-containing protein [Anaerolineae bacterium]|nr:GAF domain-containing protein [Anaerolineae bacterium]
MKPVLKVEAVSLPVDKSLAVLRWLPAVGTALWFFLVASPAGGETFLPAVAIGGALYAGLTFVAARVVPDKWRAGYALTTLALDVIYGVWVFIAAGAAPLAMVMGGVFPVIVAWVRFERVGGLFATAALGLADVLLYAAGADPIDAKTILLYGIGILALLTAGVGARRLQRLLRAVGPSTRAVEQEAIQLRIARQRARTTFDMTSRLTGSLDYRLVLDNMLDVSASSLSKVDKLVRFVLLVDKVNRNELYVEAARGLIRRDNEVRLPAREGVLAECLAPTQTKPITLSNPGDDPELRAFIALKSCRSALCVPLSTTYDRFGVLVLGTDKRNAFAEEEIELFTALGTQATIALKNARLYLDLQIEKDRIMQVDKKAREQLSKDLEQGPTQTAVEVATQTNLIRLTLERRPEKVPDKLVATEAMTRQGVKEIRHFLFALRPLVLESQGLVEALRQLADKMKDTYNQQISLEIQEETEAILTEQAKNTLFYVGYETLNLLRKLDTSKPVRLSLQRQPEAVVLEILAAENHFTRTQLEADSLQDRASLIQGVLDIRDTLQGTIIRTFVPLDSKHVKVKDDDEERRISRQLEVLRRRWQRNSANSREVQVQVASPRIDRLLFSLRWLLLIAALLWAVLVAGGSTLLVAALGGVAYNIFLLAIAWAWPDEWHTGFAVMSLALDVVLAAALFFASGADPLMLLVGGLLPVLTGWIRFGWLGGILTTLATGLAAVLIYVVAGQAGAGAPAAEALPVYGIGGFALLTAGLTGWRMYRQLRVVGSPLSTVEQEVLALRAARNRTRAAFEITSTLGVSLNLRSVLDAALELARTGLTTDAENAQIVGCMLIAKENQFAVVAERGLHPDDRERKTPGQRGAIALALRHENEPVFLKEARDDPELWHFKTFQPCQSILCLPLRADPEQGVILLATEPADGFDQAQIELFRAISAQSTVAMRNTTLYNNLQEEKDRIVQVDKEAHASLARDLHDGPTQTISAVAMRLNLIQMMLKKQPESVPQELFDVEDLTRRAIKEIRGFLNALNPAIESLGFGGALRNLAETAHDTYNQNVIVRVDPSAEAMISRQAKDAFYNIAIEGVNNARKHAEATHIWIRLHLQADAVIFEVQDDGKGFDYEMTMETYLDRESQSLGMINLRERAKTVNGEFYMRSVPGEGTLIQICLPLDSAHVKRP